MPLRHLVLFKWGDDTTEGAVEAFAAGLAELPGLIPEIRGYRFGRDLALAEGTFDFGLVADFDDEAGYRAYSVHPDHVALIENLVRPIAAQIVRVQHEL